MILPHNIEAEESLIITLLANNKAFYHCQFLEPEEFYKTLHQDIYRVMVRLNAKREQVDLLSVVSECKKEKIDCAGYLAKLADTVQMHNTKVYVRIIKEAALSRNIKLACMQIVDSELAGEDLLEQAHSSVLSVKSTQREDAIKDVKDIIIEHINRIERANSTEEAMGYKLGFPELDKRLKVRDGKLFIIAGRPGQGKTAFALTLTRNLNRHGVSVGFLSIEMPESEIMDRLLAMESNIDAGKLGKFGTLNERDIQALNDAGAFLDRSTIKIDSTGNLDIVDVERKCRKMKHDGCQVIFIDQLSQIGNRRIKSGEHTALFSENSARIARLKKDINLPIFLMHQLNRDMKNRSQKDPVLSDLKQSGRVEEDADAVLFVHRPEEYEQDTKKKEALKGLTKIIIAKNRSGATFVDTSILFDHPTTHFYSSIT